MNVFTLTFIDVTLSHAPFDWSGGFGDADIAGSGKGAKVSGSLQMANSAYLRVGLFGAAFGFDLDNHFQSKLQLGGVGSLTVVEADFALKIDAQVRNKMAEDLANMVGDVSRAIANTVGGLVPKEERLPSLSAATLQQVAALRSAVCDLAPRMNLLRDDFMQTLGALGSDNAIGTG